MSEPSSVIVLVEDQRQQVFVRRLLEKLGFRRHQIRYEPLVPSGSGEQWVRNNYVRIVEDCRYRNRSRRASTAAVIAIDADGLSVQDRLKQFDAKLKLEVDDLVIRLIPKRNIETWILCLTGRRVNEESDYKRTTEEVTSEKIAQAADILCNWGRVNTIVPEYCIDSLQQAILEIRKLK